MQDKLNIDRQIAALQNLYYVIETAEYKTVLQLLKDMPKDYSKRIILCGVGKNANIATKISETMASLGIPSMYMNTSHAPHGDFAYVGPEDIVIHISRSGKTEEMLMVINHLKTIRPNVKQILIHCKKNKEPSNADYELFIGEVAEGDVEMLAPTSSTTALLCLLDCLAVEISKEMNFSRMDFLRYHPAGALGAMLKAEARS